MRRTAVKRTRSYQIRTDQPRASLDAYTRQKPKIFFLYPRIFKQRKIIYTRRLDSFFCRVSKDVNRRQDEDLLDVYIRPKTPSIMAKDEASIQILRKFVLDCFLLIGLTLCIFATSLLWPPFQRGFFCGDQSLMFPYKGDTVTVLMLRLVGLALPILAFLICEWALLRKVRGSERCLGVRIPPWVRGFYCALASFAIGVCFVEIAVNISKNTIGRPRPHFFDVCQPSVDCTSSEWQNRYIQSSDYTCTGSQTDRFEDMRKSFLSGHSAWSAYTMLYLALYLESRMTWSGTRVIRHVLQFGAVMLSWFTALSRVTDFKHHWSDVLAGYSLGAVFAVIMWTWGTDVILKKKNHSALPQFEIAVTSQPVPQR